jgi:hypothetical protein
MSLRDVSEVVRFRCRKYLDARGLTSSASIEFEYRPTGQCRDFEVVPSRSSLTAAPGESISMRVMVTPLSGWSGSLRVFPGRRGILVASSLETIENLSGPIEVRVSGALRTDLEPGPQVTIDSPPTGLVTGDRDLTFTATITDDGTITEVYYRNEDASPGWVDVRNADTPSPFSFSDSITLVDDANVIRVYAVDDQGRQSSDAISVTYSPPPADAVSASR